MLFLYYAPFICFGGLIVGVIIGAIIDSERGGSGSSTLSMKSSMPDPLPPEHVEGYHDDRSIADKIDGRLTNIVKNPWEGVL